MKNPVEMDREWVFSTVKGEGFWVKRRSFEGGKGKLFKNTAFQEKYTHPFVPDIFNSFG